MKRRLPLFVLGLAGLGTLVYALWARTNVAAEGRPGVPATATSRIVHVTVYPNSALVTREVDVPAGKGTIELVVSPLPEQTVNTSLYSEGGNGVRVLTTRFRSRPVKEDTREEVRKLQDEIRGLTQTSRKLQADAQAAQQNMQLLTKLEGFTTASTVNATEKGKMDSEAAITLCKYLMETRGEKSSEVVRIQEEIAENQEKMDFAQRKLRELTSGTSKTERDAVIVVDKENEAPGKVRLNYLVEMASWRPQYKVRAGAKPEDPVQLEYLAAVSQQTGESWEGVELTLSTAAPLLNATPPELKMLAVGVMDSQSLAQATVPNPPGNSQAAQQMPAKGGVVFNPQNTFSQEALTKQVMENRLQAQREFNNNRDLRANDLSNYAATLEQARDLVVNPEGRNSSQLKGWDPSTAGTEGPSVTYHLASRLTIPSRNDEQVIEVTRIDMKGDYFYKAVPLLTPHVYRQANLVNRSRYVLLPGEATMYHDRDFVGRMNMPLVAIGEQFTVGFGAEPQLQVQRVMMNKSRSLQGGNQILNYEYRILVSSYKDEAVKLQLWDRLPHAENETVGVTMVKAAPETSSDAMYVREEKPKNLLRWDLTVDPQTNGEKALAVNYEFKLELARDMTISTFQSR